MFRAFLLMMLLCFLALPIATARVWLHVLTNQPDNDRLAVLRDWQSMTNLIQYVAFGILLFVSWASLGSKQTVSKGVQTDD